MRRRKVRREKKMRKSRGAVIDDTEFLNAVIRRLKGEMHGNR